MHVASPANVAGGSNVGEHWRYPEQLGNAIATVAPKNNASWLPLAQSCRPGALAAGGDLRKANLTVHDAVTWCGAQSQCRGFTARNRGASCVNASAGTTVLEIYFKAAAGSGGNTDKMWSSWSKPSPGHAADGNGFHTEESCESPLHSTALTIRSPGLTQTFPHFAMPTPIYPRAAVRYAVQRPQDREASLPVGTGGCAGGEPTVSILESVPY
jgi:hypothetical protein